MQILVLSLTAFLTGTPGVLNHLPVALLALRLIGRASLSCQSDRWELPCPE